MAKSVFERLDDLEKENRALWSEIRAHMSRLNSQLETVSSLRERIMELERKERKMNPSNS